MDIELLKQKIKEEIEQVTDVKLLSAIARLLHGEQQAPVKHNTAAQDREAKYKKGKEKMLDWDDVEKDISL